MRRRPLSCLWSVSGFSLVEVAVSIAIVSFAMVSIMGLVPMGLTNFRQAMNNTVESEIVQSITGEIQLTGFSNLSASKAYYDAEGNPLSSSASAVYTVTTSFAPVKSVTNGGSFPLDLSTTADEATISIVNKTQPTQPHTYTVIVANENN